MIITDCNYCGKKIRKKTLYKTNFCSRKHFDLYKTGWNWNNFIPWNKSKKNVYSKQTLNIMRNKKLGYKASINTRKKMSNKHRGNKTNLWRGGINSLSDMIRRMINGRLWRESVYKRDDWTCVECDNRGLKLHAHHIKSFSKILKEFLATYSQFSSIDDKETLVRLASRYEDFWDIDNGITLCIDCHKKTDSYLKIADKWL